MYSFPKDLIKHFRDSAVSNKRGLELSRLITSITGNNSYEIGGKHYKKVPAGYDTQHPRAELLLHNGLYAYYEALIPRETYSPDFIDYCFKIFRDLSPLHLWLVNMGAGK